MSTTVSVIIPARNAAGCLPECLRALLPQMKEGGETLVVDDGSEDRTREVAESLGARVIVQGPRGPAAARNAGARSSQGDIILFTDADCVPSESWVQHMVAPFAIPEVAGVKGSYRTLQKGVMPLLAQVEFEERYDLLEESESIDMVDTHAAAFRRHVFLQSGGFDEGFEAASNEDTELSYRLSRSGLKLVFAREAWVFHRHPSSLFEYARKKFWRGYWRVKAYSLHPGKMAKDTYTPQSLKLQIALLGLMGMSGGAGGILGSAVLLWVSGAALCLFLLSGAGFLRRAFGRSMAVGLMAPAFLLIRAGALGAGFGVGTPVWMLRAHPKTPASLPEKTSGEDLHGNP